MFFPLNVLVLQLSLSGRVPDRPPYPPPVGEPGSLGRGLGAAVINCTERVPFGLDAHVFASFVFTVASWENEGEPVYSITRNIHVRCQGNTVIRGGGGGGNTAVSSSVSSSCPGSLVGRHRRRDRMWWGQAEWHLLKSSPPTRCLGGGLSGGLGQTAGEWGVTGGGVTVGLRRRQAPGR